MQGLCDAITEFNKIPGTTRRLYLGDTSSRGAAQGLSNIAALLAQAMWESGGEAPFTACDENNYKHSPTAACTQRSDGSLYASLNDQPHACAVDKGMTMTAVTAASWATQGPMKCAPGTATEGCCWWGRGAIQTTGPNNYGALNKEVMQKIPTLQDRGIDICTNPEALCQHPDTKWLGAVFYWANNVQGFTDSHVAAMFHESLDKFVESGFLNSASVVSGSDFPTGTGGLVNNGFWTAAAHKNGNRVAYFNKIMRLFKDAGMTVDGGENGSGATSPPNDDNGAPPPVVS
eukprot:g2243.t1